MPRRATAAIVLVMDLLSSTIMIPISTCLLSLKAPPRGSATSCIAALATLYRIGMKGGSRFSMKIHADILRMAATEERRDLIKWYHARRVFFVDLRFREALALAEQSKHPDARFLVSLFRENVPFDKQDAGNVFRAHSEDARCWCWASELSYGADRSELLKRSAEAGYAYAQYLYGKRWHDEDLSETSRAERFSWLEKAVAQDEPCAMCVLGYWLRESNDAEKDARAERLWREGASLGDSASQFALARFCCMESSLEQAVWMRRAGLQSVHAVVNWGLLMVIDRWEDNVAGKLLFELGCILSIHDPTVNERVYTAPRVVQAVHFHMAVCEQAKRAVLCWIWLARSLGVGKDIRRVIADLIWDGRAEWSETVELAACAR